MPLEQNRSLDVRWTGANLGAVAAACLVAAAGLVLSFAAGRFELGSTPAVDSARVAAVRQRVNPNTASFSSLRRLPDLGPAHAKAILDYRAAHGPAPFRTADDLTRIPGIKAATVANFRDYLDFTPAGD
jgi:competence ComEA-like helix-hairpin-helix protein